MTGRYLIHVLDCEADEIQRARSRLREDGHYGLAWAEHVSDTSRLPYAENIVNLIVVRDYTVGVDELSRVLTPGGTVVVTNTDVLNKTQLEAAGFQVSAAPDSNLIARKPWPEAMDVWSHPRHSADGNPVSGDTLVGPPDRVRWIAAATSEVEGMVTAGGRNFYGGILSRDSFNGLRLWHRDLKKGDINPPEFDLPRLSANDARPIASERLLFAVRQLPQSSLFLERIERDHHADLEPDHAVEKAQADNISLKESKRSDCKHPDPTWPLAFLMPTLGLQTGVVMQL